MGQMRAWQASGGRVILPKHRSGADVATALAMAKLDGPLEAILLLVCCEDLSQWPTVLRYGRVCLPHRFADEALTDAMHRIMWRRPVMPLEARAKSLGVRKDAYRLARVRAEEMVGGWTENAAVRFLLAFRRDA